MPINMSSLTNASPLQRSDSSADDTLCVARLLELNLKRAGE
jgi:hypothetical protein